MQSGVVSPTCRLAGGKFDDFRRDLFLPYLPLRRLQGGKLALDLVARRGHRFHARFVLRREGVERGVAKLRVQVIRGELAQKRLRRQVQERRVGIRRTGKLRHVEGKQAAALHMGALARLHSLKTASSRSISPVAIRG